MPGGAEARLPLKTVERLPSAGAGDIRARAAHYSITASDGGPVPATGPGHAGAPAAWLARPGGACRLPERDRCGAGWCYPGLWAKLRILCAACSTAMTKQTRSGPRLGNGAFVYLNEIGSMYRQPSSRRTSTTRPWIAAIR